MGTEKGVAMGGSTRASLLLVSFIVFPTFSFFLLYDLPSGSDDIAADRDCLLTVVSCPFVQN